jgi:rhodanese-related sulfurtransferase
MNDIIAFLINHWVLTGLVFVTMVAIGVVEFRFKQFGLLQLSTQELVSAMNHDQALVLDLREQEAYRKGHILGAVNLPVSQWDEKIDTVLKKFTQGPIILVCQLGTVSAKKGATLAKQQDRPVRLLAGGLTAWIQAALPLHSEK